MAILTIYNSSTGFTQKYAEWLQNETGCDLLSYKNKNKADFNQYDTIIFASSLHASKIKGIAYLKKQLPKIKNKRICLLVTGVMPNLDQKAFNKILDLNFTHEQKAMIQPFFVLSGLNYEKMNFLDKTMMFGLKNFLKRKAGKESDVYKYIVHSFDYSSKDRLIPLLNYLNKNKSLD